MKAEVDAAGTTYAQWYQTRIVSRTLAEVARELNCPLEAFCTSLGLGWNIEVVTTEFSLTTTQADKLLETIGEATIGEVLALALTMGPTKFVAGPLALLVDIVISCDLTSFYSYLVIAQGQLRSLTRWGHLMTSKDQQDYSAQLERMRASVQHWLYSTLVFAAGLFVGVDQPQPLHNANRQITRETAGFPMPQQIADLTLAEVEDFVAAMAPVLAPIFGAIGVCRYPTKPLAIALQVHMTSFSTYLQGRSHWLTHGCWRDAAWVHHLEIGKAIGRKSDGSFARPYKEGMPSAARVRPHQLVLRAPQPGRSPLQIPLEPGFYSKGNSRQH